MVTQVFLPRLVGVKMSHVLRIITCPVAYPVTPVLINVQEVISYVPLSSWFSEA